MFNINNKKFRLAESERERFSNFVVDLRKQEKVIVKDIKSRQKMWQPNLKLLEFKILDIVKDFFQKLAGIFKGVIRPSKKKVNKFSWPKFSGFFSKKIKPRCHPKHPWLGFVRSQENLFSARVAHINNSRTNNFYKSSVWAFILILLFIILPFQLALYWPLGNLSEFVNKISNRSELAINNLLTAANSASQRNFKNADSEFQAAGANFLAAQEDLSRINSSILSLATLSDNPKFKLAAESKKFLQAGTLASSLGSNLVLAADSLFNGNQEDFSASLDNFLLYGQQAGADATSLKKCLDDINLTNLPEAYHAKFLTLKNQSTALSDNLSGLVATAKKLKEVLGLSGDKRYLVVFQNNAELRASGGFLGSYALIDLRDGKIRNLEVPGGGAYDTEGGLKVRVAAPEPLWLVNTLWHFWDANWWPDWPTTAQNLMWFYSKSDGPSVDGVISVTPTVIEDLLKITGPIDLNLEYGLTINSDNFWQTVQMITEQSNLAVENPVAVAGLPTSSLVVVTDLPLQQNLDTNPDNKPKKIIGDLLVKILEILPQKLTPDNLVNIIELLDNNLAGKQILMYFNDPILQSAASDRNWAGVVADTDKDYLLVVNTNIAGQKTDRLIQEDVAHLSEVAADGTIINTVKITRRHSGVKGTVLTGVRNVDWLRVYVPAGSELLSSSGWRVPDAKYLQNRPDTGMSLSPRLVAENAAKIDMNSGTKIYQENNKTVFANWLMLDPGETATVSITYRLPFNFFDSSVSDNWLKRLNAWLNPKALKLFPYSLLVQKQPGASADNFSSRLILPDTDTIFWRYPADMRDATGWSINSSLSRDRYWSVLVQKNQSH